MTAWTPVAVIPSALALRCPRAWPGQAAAPRADASRVQHIVVEEAAEERARSIVVEDEGSRIEELRVRGATQRITVQPKVGTTKLRDHHRRRLARPRRRRQHLARRRQQARVWNVLKF